MSGSGLWMTVGHESVMRGSCQEFVGVVWRALQAAEDLSEWGLSSSGCLVKYLRDLTRCQERRTV